MKDFFNEYKWWLVIALIVPIVVSYVWFTYDGFIPIGSIDKGDWLSFWGGFLAFYGTFFLGMVAIWQSKLADEQNKRLLDIEHSRHSCNVILKSSAINLPFIRLSNEKKDDCKSNNNIKRDMHFIITNHGDAMLKKIKILFPNNQVFLSHIVLAKGESKYIGIEIPKNFDCEKKVEIFFISCNNITTHGDFKISFIGNYQAEVKYYHFYGLQGKENKNE